MTTDASKKPNRMGDALGRVDQRALDRASRLAHMDAWVNDVTGFGTSRDKTTYGRFNGRLRLADAELTALYNGNDLAARMVDHVPDEMFREGVIVETGDATVDAWVAERLDNLCVCERFADGERWGRLYGGGAVLLGADDGRPASKPLAPERARGVRYLYDFDRRALWPASYYTTPGHPKLGQPETYLVTSNHVMASTATVVHESRLLLFGGAKTDHWTRWEFGGWDLSILQRPNDVIRMFETGWKAVEIMLTDGNQGVFTMAGLADLLGTPGGLDAIQTRIQMIDMHRSTVRAMVLDAGTKDEPTESFERQTVAFDSIPQVLEKFCLRLAASVPMPVTLLMGQSPAGMNATGDSDFRGHYDRLKSRQTLHVAPRVRYLVKLLLQSKDSPTKGKIPDTITVTFPPLWTPTPMEEATRRKTIAEADNLQITSQMYTPEEVALVRGRPDGWDASIVLSDEAIKARKQALDLDLEDLAAGISAGPTGNPTGAPVDAPPEHFDAVLLRRALGDAKLFELHRHEDETGVSGTGVIADGVVFPDGKVALRWRTETASTTFFDSVEDMLRVHGHAGKTEMVFVGATS